MEFIINNETYNFSQEELDYRYLGEGEEAVIYFYKDKALKIYKENCRVDRLNEEESLFFQTMHTERILLPLDNIYKINYDFNGYTTNRVTSYSKENFKRLKLEFLKREILYLQRDLLTLSSNYVSIFDIENYNLVLGNGIYFVDPGKYRREKEDPTEINFNYLRSVIINEILCASRRLTIEERKRINERFTIDDLLSSNESTISSYCKKLAKY